MILTLWLEERKMNLQKNEEKEIIRRIYVGRQENQRIGGIRAYLEYEISEIIKDINANNGLVKYKYENQLLKFKKALRLLEHGYEKVTLNVIK